MYEPSYNSRCRPRHQVPPLKRDLNSSGYPNKIVPLPRTPTPGHDKGCRAEIAALHAIMSCRDESCDWNFIVSTHIAITYFSTELHFRGAYKGEFSVIPSHLSFCRSKTKARTRELSNLTFAIS
jgi:hypothetical protein